MGAGHGSPHSAGLIKAQARRLLRGGGNPCCCCCRSGRQVGGVPGRLLLCIRSGLQRAPHAAGNVVALPERVAPQVGPLVLAHQHHRVAPARWDTALGA